VLPDHDPSHAQLLEGFELEWNRYQSLLSTHSIRTLYFGGGTPSLLKAQELGRILDMIRQTHSLENLEITLEANPERMSEENLKELYALGINRLSFGVQSFDDGHLSLLGRTHDSRQAQQAIRLAHDVGFRNISLDLMYDLPHQTLASFANSLHQAAQLPITHLSLYNLTIEPHTQYFKQKEALTPHLPNQELSLQMYQTAQEILGAFGFEQYEISAFAKPGFASQHNSGYWMGTPFLGFGPSAFSYYAGKRFRNIANLKRYSDALKRGESPVDFEEELSPESRQKELLAIQLRLLNGVELQQFTLPEETKNNIDNLIELELLKREEETLLLTQKGILLYDSVAIELI
jgi:putative oxygen-independent coproporphyrinogen III oxidase